MIVVGHLLGVMTFCRLESLERMESTYSSTCHWDWWWDHCYLYSFIPTYMSPSIRNKALCHGYWLIKIILHSELEDLILSEFTCKLVLQSFLQAVNVLHQRYNFRTVKSVAEWWSWPCCCITFTKEGPWSKNMLCIGEPMLVDQTESKYLNNVAGWATA